MNADEKQTDFEKHINDLSDNELPTANIIVAR